MEIDTHSVALTWVKGGECMKRTPGTRAAEELKKTVARDVVELWNYDRDGGKDGQQHLEAFKTLEFPFVLKVSRHCLGSVGSRNEKGGILNKLKSGNNGEDGEDVEMKEFVKVFYQVKATLLSEVVEKVNATSLSSSSSTTVNKIDTPKTKLIPFSQTSVPVTVSRVRPMVPTDQRPRHFLSGTSWDTFIQYRFTTPVETFLGERTIPMQVEMWCSKEIREVDFIDLVMKQESEYRIVVLREDMEEKRVDRLPARPMIRHKVGERIEWKIPGPPGFMVNPPGSHGGISSGSGGKFKLFSSQNSSSNGPATTAVDKVRESCRSRSSSSNSSSSSASSTTKRSKSSTRTQTSSSTTRSRSSSRSHAHPNQPHDQISQSSSSSSKSRSRSHTRTTPTHHQLHHHHHHHNNNNNTTTTTNNNHYNTLPKSPKSPRRIQSEDSLASPTKLQQEKMWANEEMLRAYSRLGHYPDLPNKPRTSTTTTTESTNNNENLVIPIPSEHGDVIYSSSSSSSSSSPPPPPTGFKLQFTLPVPTQPTTPYAQQHTLPSTYSKELKRFHFIEIRVRYHLKKEMMGNAIQRALEGTRLDRFIDVRVPIGVVMGAY
jgi:hypothetical protein